ncbi:hypothetical protein CONLIGDRAFT_650766 [Coniochaeta ligniaria NRRL 30616]|uniref:Secreted protein n=1 Tax=Coniochaeta ligniaria NRRL 30616 TaxID=1408157 RepID=A0A1J7IZ44_9PEZI|nr:hypothetical protein CONLIGDRAFT_650766 [Coniochaeta ligniaria NRRL 30616]
MSASVKLWLLLGCYLLDTLGREPPMVLDNAPMVLVSLSRACHKTVRGWYSEESAYRCEAPGVFFLPWLMIASYAQDTFIRVVPAAPWWDALVNSGGGVKVNLV